MAFICRDKIRTNDKVAVMIYIWNLFKNKFKMLNTRLDMRLSQEVKTKALLGLKSLTEYVVHLMDEDATKVIKQHESMVIENNCFDQFMQACDKAKLPNKALKDAAKLTKKLNIK